jgi:hypothetical protein
MIFIDHRGNILIFSRVEKTLSIVCVAHKKAGAVSSVKVRIFGVFEIPSVNPFPNTVNIIC